MILLDSGVIAAFLDADNPFHAVADEQLRAVAGQEELIVSVITFAAIMAGVYNGHHEIDPVLGFFADLVEVHDVDPAIAERAAQHRAAPKSLRMPDALILATAEAMGAALVITTDGGWKGVETEVEIRILTV